MNPCPYRWLNDPQISEANSSPLSDRFDIHIEMLRMDYEKLSGDRMGETSSLSESKNSARTGTLEK
jgi:magnesium chelatase family protein